MDIERRPTLFLNLDGVVHRTDMAYVMSLELSGPDVPRPFEWAEPLRPTVEGWNAAVVLRSTATTMLGFEKVKAFAPPWLQTRIVGVADDVVRWLTLYDLRKVNSSCGVVRNYVKASGLQWWAALDDDAEGWHYDESMLRRLVKCDPSKGLTDPAVLMRLDEVLRAGRDELDA